MAWLYQQPGSKYWWLGDRIDGQLRAWSTKKADQAEAEKTLAEYNSMKMARAAGKLSDEFYEALSGKSLPTVALKSALKDWLAECEGSTAPDTLERYRDVAEAFETHLRATDEAPLLRDVTTADAFGCLADLRRKRSAATVNLYRKILSSFFVRCVKNGLLKSNPVWPIKRFKENRAEASARRAYTLAELQLMHAKAPNDFWRYMIVGGFYTGLRMGDLILRQWGTADLDQNVLRVTAGKTGTRVNIPIAAPLRSLLLSLKSKAGTVKASDYIWPDQADQYQKHGAKVFSNEFYDEILTPCGLATLRKDKKGHKAGRGSKRAVSEVSFHSLRHTFISFLKTTGSNQAVAKELAGHASDAVNDLYTHVPEESLTNAIKQLPEVTQ